LKVVRGIDSDIEAGIGVTKIAGLAGLAGNRNTIAGALRKLYSERI
jgi:hypothetical protein